MLVLFLALVLVKQHLHVLAQVVDHGLGHLGAIRALARMNASFSTAWV